MCLYVCGVVCANQRPTNMRLKGVVLAIGSLTETPSLCFTYNHICTNTHTYTYIYTCARAHVLVFVCLHLHIRVLATMTQRRQASKAFAARIFSNNFILAHICTYIFFHILKCLHDSVWVREREFSFESFLLPFSFIRDCLPLLCFVSIICFRFVVVVV